MSSIDYVKLNACARSFVFPSNALRAKTTLAAEIAKVSNTEINPYDYQLCLDIAKTCLEWIAAIATTLHKPPVTSIEGTLNSMRCAYNLSFAGRTASTTDDGTTFRYRMETVASGERLCIAFEKLRELLHESANGYITPQSDAEASVCSHLEQFARGLTEFQYRVRKDVKDVQVIIAQKAQLQQPLDED